ncbi:MAG: glycosyltransferase [Bauldia sp.]|nr:glycosyltransferase [Bauldia sp.]
MTVAVPVVLFLFNRPATLSRVIDAVLAARPETVVAIADGPRANWPDDGPRCAAARALVDRLEGQCAVVRHYSETNLGCDARIRSGLDWVFERYPEAIVLEDDVLPDPSFLPWAERMLHRYRDRPEVMHVSGRNHLGRWTLSGDGHALTRRASAWGWATWRRAWQCPVETPGNAAALANAPGAASVDPLVAEQFLMLQEAASNAGPVAWDCAWELKKALAGGLSVVPAVNLTAHIGYGPGATHNRYAADIGASVPVFSVAGRPDAVDRCEDDSRLDRWQMMIELMATYRAPEMVRRLARMAQFPAAAGWAGDRRLRQHLAPFRHAEETLAVLEHFCASGAPREPLADLFGALRGVAGRPAAARPAVGGVA